MSGFTVSRTRALVLAVGAVALVLVASRHFHSQPATSAPPIVTVGVTGSAGSATPVSPTTQAATVVVDVAGDVRRPGLYTLPQGSRIADAVARAGGATARADTSLVNLAAPLADGEQVLVPGRTGDGGAAAPTGPSPTAPVDLNSATAEQLDALPGIGPVTAQKIVDYRQAHGPFKSVDDLDAIPGIGAAKIDSLRGLVTPS